VFFSSEFWLLAPVFVLSLVMEAMILAAGQGTRLLPLTQNRPKPLFPVLNRPLLEITLDYLSRFSLERVILNSHHLASQIENFVQIKKAGSLFEMKTSFEPKILGTGGGIGQTRDFWKSDWFLAINGDILTDMDLQKAIDFHRSHHGLVTLILHDYPEFNQISVHGSGLIQNFKQDKGLAFTGIHILNKGIFDFLPASGPYEIIPVYQKMIQGGLPIWAYVSTGHYWRDMGTPKSYLKVHEEGLSGERKVLIHPEARIEKGVAFSGWACIGKNGLLKKGCHVQNSVLWEDVTVEAGVSVFESIIGQGVHVQKNQQGGVLI
jgi:mannose-1-phosphate guanylyltransferase